MPPDTVNFEWLGTRTCRQLISEYFSNLEWFDIKNYIVINNDVVEDFESISLSIGEVENIKKYPFKFNSSYLFYNEFSRNDDIYIPITISHV